MGGGPTSCKNVGRLGSQEEWNRARVEKKGNGGAANQV